MALLVILVSSTSTLCAASRAFMAAAHVSVYVSCADTASSKLEKFTAQLFDVIISGRVYYPTVVTTPSAGGAHLDFDAPEGVYEMFLRQESTAPSCSWSGPLMLAGGTQRHISLVLKSSTINLWDRGDFAIGSIDSGAEIAVANVPMSVRCGSRWAGDANPATVDGGEYYAEFAWLNHSLQRPALVITQNKHSVILALHSMQLSPLRDHHFVKRDISNAELDEWSRLPSGTVICDPKAAVEPKVHTWSNMRNESLQEVTITALTECAEANNEYARETPELEVEDQLHRGRFFSPQFSVKRLSPVTVRLRLKLPPGAYALGIRLPTPAKASLPCYHGAVFAVLPGVPRALTFRISSSGIPEGSRRGFIAGSLFLPSVNVAVTTISRSLRCGKELPDIQDIMSRVSTAAMDEGHYYSLYDPYDPAMRPALVVDAKESQRKLLPSRCTRETRPSLL